MQLWNGALNVISNSRKSSIGAYSFRKSTSSSCVSNFFMEKEVTLKSDIKKFTFKLHEKELSCSFCESKLKILKIWRYSVNLDWKNSKIFFCESSWKWLEVNTSMHFNIKLVKCKMKICMEIEIFDQ